MKESTKSNLGTTVILTGLLVFAIIIAGSTAWFTNTIAYSAGLTNNPLAELPEDAQKLSEAAANACNKRGFRRFFFNEHNCTVARFELQSYFEAKAVPVKKNSLTETILNAGRANNVDPDLILLLAIQESGLNPNARSHVGALGITQFMPATAKSYGINPKNVVQSINATGRFLASSKAKFKDDRLALACYNAGCGAVAKHGGIPPYGETQNYVKSIYTKFTRLKEALNG